jgi:predicted nucleotidyltransferase
MVEASYLKILPERTAEILERTRATSGQRIEAAKRVVEGSLIEGIERHCFVVVGSVGRLEALDASDFDLLPIADLDSASDHASDQSLREALRSALEVGVSAGEDLTRSCTISDLVDPETIGGHADTSASLTRRILLLTESQHVAGGVRLDALRRQVLDAYVANGTTRGRHALSFANDVARYYRTLCIEYKGKVDAYAKSWATRNAKLRHCRKFWYLSTALSVVAAATHERPESTRDRLLDFLARPPVDRLWTAGEELGVPTSVVAELITSYAWFLNFMSDENRRRELDLVEHETRYELDGRYAFQAVKANSDVLHGKCLELITSLSAPHQNRLLSWFLL